MLGCKHWKESEFSSHARRSQEYLKKNAKLRENQAKRNVRIQKKNHAIVARLEERENVNKPKKKVKISRSRKANATSVDAFRKLLGG
jgi:hypothetical protein